MEITVCLERGIQTHNLYDTGAALQPATELWSQLGAGRVMSL